MNLTIQINCPAFYDSYLLWPETAPNETVYQNCTISSNLFEFGKAFRHCHFSGKWTNVFGEPSENINGSYTNFDECFKSKTYNLPPERIKTLNDLTKPLSYIAIGGLILGSFTLTMSILILTKFKYLMNYRTKIHKQLFIALLFETALQMSLHIDLLKEDSDDSSKVNNRNDPKMNGFSNLRSAIYEYFVTSVFLWMLVEGVHIHNIIAVNVFHTRYWFNCYLFMGWIIPIPITLTWAVLMSVRFSSTQKWKYIYSENLYWIMAIVRIFCIFINIVFLINVIRVLVLKLRANNSSDVCQAKTAIKAAILLIPLLGVINFVQMINLDMQSFGYLVLLTLQGLLPSYQGLFVSIVFCLINKDIRKAVIRSYNKYRMRNNLNSGFRLKVARWDSKNKLKSNQNTMTSTLLSNTETKTNMFEHSY